LVTAMSALNRKLARDLWRLRGQVVAVALVIASGVALLVMSLSALSSLRATSDAYYDRYRFAEVFAGVKRAPERLATRIRAIPGVQTVETRISALATLDIEGWAEPVIGQLISLPERGEPLLNRLALRAGRTVAPGRDDEAVLHEPFAEAHELGIGDTIEVLMNGAKRRVRVVGIALSPEYVYAIAPGVLMPDDARFGIIWMGRNALAAVYDLDGAFNYVSLALLRGANPEEVIDRLDLLLERYGGVGAIPRADQVSNWFLMNEFEQLKTTATILPGIFLAVAAFLTNTVLARLIATERREISLMKAFGYSNLEVGLHYSKMAVAMAAVGLALGWAVGAGLGRYETQLYSELFLFPFLHFRPSGTEFVISAVVSLAAALFGAVWAVNGAVTLPPAEAMRPPAPESFRGATLPASVARRLDNPTRIILRQIARSPVRAAMTTTGVALSVAVLITALQWQDAITELVLSYFDHSQHQDLTIGFFEPRSIDARFELSRMPGVRAVEPMRISPADFSAGGKLHRGAITGLPTDAGLQVIDDVRGWVLPVPRGGIVLGTKLAEKLGVGVGDTVSMKVLEGLRPDLVMPVTGLHEAYIGMPAYMNLSVLNRELGDPPVFMQANLLIDQRDEAELFAALKELPSISTVIVKKGAITTFFETMGETILVFISFFVAFSCSLAVGVIYNAARVTLSERGRELATLRVLGFTRWEISYILLGEAALLMLAALPIGCLAGAGLAWIMNSAFETELFRVPFVVVPSTYAKAVLIVVAASVVSAALVRRRLDRLDLIAVLKTRE
jgi:putative ABC transport system permease protein